MTTEVRPVSQQTIVRHYRAATRGEVEQAYRAEALQAAGAGYIPLMHTWSQDAQGTLLAVTYSGPAAPPKPRTEPPPVQPEQTASAPKPEPPAEAHPSPEPEAEPAPEPDAVAAEPQESQAEPEPEPEAETEPEAELLPEPDVAERPAYTPVQRIAAMERETNEEPSAVADEAHPVAIPKMNGMAPPAVLPNDEFTAARPDAAADSFAPAPESDWQAPAVDEPDQQVERYSPPPEMYLPSPDMYVPVTAEVEGSAGSEAVAESEPEAESESVAEAEPAAVAEPEPMTLAEPLPEVESGLAPLIDQRVVTMPEATRAVAKMTLQVMDLHTAGEPLRLIRSGFPEVPRLPVLERRQWVKDNADHVRRALMYEPRGHKDMYGAILLPPYNDYADITVLFMHNEGYSTMCGHGVIAITTGLIEDGLFPATEPVTTIRYEVPAGIVAANAATVQLDDGTWAVRGVRFTNVPSYLAAQSLSVKPDGVELFGTAAQYGALGVDLAFGGAYYGIVNAAELGLRVVPEQADELRRVGSAITEVLRRDHTPAHPSDPDLSFVYGTIIVDLDPRTSPDDKASDAHIRNATIFAEAELDRSPCGSGTSAILAQLHARGRIKVGQEIVNAGITGEHFLGRVEAETVLGPYAAVSTSIAGTAYITGYSTFVVDSRDPLGDGFLLG